MRIICFALFVLFSQLISAQEQLDFEFNIDSKHFKKERKIYVHLPEDYYLLNKEKMGVVYVLDGQGTSFFNNAKSIIDYLVWGNQIFPVIVVGIHSDDRGPEFVPKDKTKSVNDPDSYGTADLLSSHLSEEVFPLVEEKFRTSEFRALIGHSRGGAFVANTLFGDNKDMFNAYVAISPGMHYVNNQILDRAETSIKRGDKFNKFFFASYGTIGTLEEYFKPQVEFIDSLLLAHPNPTLMWEKMEFKNTTHWGVVAPTITYAMLSMSRAYQADQYIVEQFCQDDTKDVSMQIDNYYKQQEEKLGLTYPIPARKLRYYGEQQSEKENYSCSLQFYKMSIAKEANNHNGQSGVAWCYAKLGNLKGAIKHYKQCILIVSNNDMGWNEEKKERVLDYYNAEVEKIKAQMN